MSSEPWHNQPIVVRQTRFFFQKSHCRLSNFFWPKSPFLAGIADARFYWAAQPIDKPCCGRLKTLSLEPSCTLTCTCTLVCKIAHLFFHCSLECNELHGCCNKNVLRESCSSRQSGQYHKRKSQYFGWYKLWGQNSQGSNTRPYMLTPDVDYHFYLWTLFGQTHA